MGQATKTRYRPPTLMAWWATKNRYRPPTFIGAGNKNTLPAPYKTNDKAHSKYAPRQ